jgi:hypothetical protein
MDAFDRSSRWRLRWHLDRQLVLVGDLNALATTTVIECWAAARTIPGTPTAQLRHPQLTRQGVWDAGGCIDYVLWPDLERHNGLRIGRAAPSGVSDHYAGGVGQRPSSTRREAAREKGSQVFTGCVFPGSVMRCHHEPLPGWAASGIVHEVGAAGEARIPGPVPRRTDAPRCWGTSVRRV